MRPTDATWSDTAHAAREQMRVVHALMLREVKTRFGRLRLGYLWALIEPIFFVGVFFIIFTLAGRSTASGMPLTPFLITGAVPYIMFRDTMIAGLHSVNANRSLLTFPQVSPFSVVLARSLLEITTHVVAMVLLLVATALFIEPVRIEDPLMVVVWLVLAGGLGYGAGLGLGAVGAVFPSVEQLVPTLVARPMFFISGLFFTAEMMPVGLREVALYNPLLHIVELLRSAFFVEFESRHDDPTYAVLTVLVGICVGMLVQRALNKKILTQTPG